MITGHDHAGLVKQAALAMACRRPSGSRRKTMSIPAGGAHDPLTAPLGSVAPGAGERGHGTMVGDTGRALSGRAIPANDRCSGEVNYEGCCDLADVMQWARFGRGSARSGPRHLMHRTTPMTVTRSKALVLLDSQRHALARIAAGDPLVDVLAELVQDVDVAAGRHAEDALRNQTRRLETFNRLSKSIATDLDLERIVQTVTDIATELSGAKFGAFFYNLTDGKGERYLLYTLSGAPRE